MQRGGGRAVLAVAALLPLQQCCNHVAAQQQLSHLEERTRVEWKREFRNRELMELGQTER